MSFDRREFAVKMPALAASAALSLKPSFAQEAGQDGVEREFVSLPAEDKVSSWGLVYRPKGRKSRTGVVIMHPTASSAEHFFTARLAARGFTVLGQAGRWVNNDTYAVQEATLLDVAASIRLLRERYGVSHVLCLGHSAGAGLYAYYQVQAATPPPGRFRTTPAGDPFDLNRFNLPPLDGFIAAAPSARGYLLLNWLDPAVVDEANPLATDWTLDLYDPRNGYRAPPESSNFSPEFIQRFRAGQRERAKRLDAKARALIARQRSAAEQMKSPDFARLALEQQLLTRRTALYEEFMVIYRTHACRESDLSFDPSDRNLSPPVWRDPQIQNFATQGGILRAISPHAYLSTWSPPSTRLQTDENLAKITVPTLIVGGTGDEAITPNIVRSAFEHAAAKDKAMVFVKGASHDYLPVEPAAGGKNPRDEGARIIAEWIRVRFPPA